MTLFKILNMKKLFYLLSIPLFLFGCSGEPGPQGPRGPQGPAGVGVNYTIINFSIDPVDWQPYGSPGDVDFQYFAEYNAPEIDAYAFNNGLILGYLIDNGTAYTLPNTINYGDYTREYSFYFGIGYIGFIVKDTDLQTVAPNGFLDYRIYVVDPQGKKSGMEDWTPKEWEALRQSEPKAFREIDMKLKPVRKK